MFNLKKTTDTTKKPTKPSFWNQFYGFIFILLAIFALYILIFGEDEKPEPISLSELSEMIQAEEVETIEVQGQKLVVTLSDEEATILESKKERESSLSETLINYGVTSEDLSSVNIEITRESGFGYWLGRFTPILIPILFLLLFFWLLTRSAKGQGMQAFSFGQSKAKILDPNDKGNITFKDVAGVKEAKEELEEVVDFLKNPKKFLDIGAQIPKGVLLEGEPGTGKTLLARAVAGEAKVPFFHLSGSDFVEMFVGVGASRVRDLFKMAKKAAPSIVFIDEIDAVGRRRGSGHGGGNDEREQTLNQILTEMDGFDQNQKVIVIAATNRVDVLDPALTRPGRFDRKVHVDLPDRKDRVEILKIHARKKPFDETVKLEILAERTPGFSGADLYSLMNEGAIRAARQDRKKITQEDLISSIEKVMIGPERKSHLFSKKEKRITAYHEGGHALIASLLPHADPVHKVTIVSRGHAGGYTLKLPLEERKLQTKKEFIDDIAMTLGGYAAEELVMGDITTGPSNDLKQATRLARAMVTKWGMSEKIGPIALEGSRNQLAYGQESSKDYSEAVSALVDSEVSKIINEGLETARKLVKERKDLLDAIADALIENETLEEDEFNKLLEKFNVEPKRREKTAK
jgi:cell division protease FtsH